MTRHSSTVISLLGALALAAPSAAVLDTKEAVEGCIESNRPDASVQSVTIEAVDTAGQSRIHEAKIYQQKFPDGTRALIRLSSPPDLRNSALLLIEKGDRSDMFMYLPELGKVRRVSKYSVNGSMFGTDLTYEDFERLQGLAEDAESALLPPTVRDDRAVYVIEARPARGAESEYTRTLSYVDQETCVPVRTEFFGKDDELVKVLVSPREELRKTGEGWVPFRTRMDDLEEGTHTELRVGAVEVEESIPRKFFSERELLRGGR